MDRFLEFIADVTDGTTWLFRGRGDSYVDLETSDHRIYRDTQGNETAVPTNTLVRPNGTLVTLIRVRGAQTVIGDYEMKEFANKINTAFTTPMKGAGHTIEIVFRRDVDFLKRDLEETLAPARRTAKRLGMDVDWIIDAKRDTLMNWCSSEDAWIAISTDYGIFSTAEINQAGKDRDNEIDANPLGKTAMIMAGPASSMRASHLAMVDSIQDGLAQANIDLEILDAHEALWVIRREFDPEATALAWRPLLPGDPIPARFPTTEKKDDLSSVLYPSLKTQLVPRAPGKIQRNRWIEIGDRIHAPMVMSMPPQMPLPFDTFMRPLINSDTPFRISITMTAGGLGEVSVIKRMIASLTSFFSKPNRQFAAAFRELEERVVQGDTVIGMRVVADTWAKVDEPEVLRNRAEYLNKAIQSWGQSDVRDVVGDPLLGVCATIPGMTIRNPAPASTPPLHEVVSMLPLSRPSSPWKTGALPFRSADGKIMPYQPGSGLQKSWVTLGFAPMGAGKSVLLNAHNFALALLPGLSRLPYISILDIGPSSSGLISLLKHSLPPDRQHEVLHRRLRMHPDDAINPFETPMGLRTPLPEHRAMLVDFLVALATPEGEEKAQDGIPGIAQTVVDLVFDTVHPDNQPKRYDRRADPGLSEAVEELGIPVDNATTWFEIEDALFDKGRYDLAQRAHTRAVPILPDCAQAVRDRAVMQVYTGTASTNESLPDYFWRAVNESIQRFPILSRPTQFSVGSARVVALDLADVCPKGGPAAVKQSGVMYGLARYAVAQRYYLDGDSIPFFPERYRNYYHRQVERLKGEPKLLSMDEFHRTGGLAGIRKIIENDIREGRKFGVQVALFSQSPNDFDEILVDLSTTRFVLGADTPESANDIAERFGLTESAASIILNRITKPGPSGAALYISTRTNKGSSEMFSYLTIGPIELWAYNSSAKDRALRDALYTRIGVKKTLTLLSRRWPSGSAEKEIDLRQEQMGDISSDSDNSIIDDLVKEVVEMAMREDETAP